MVTNGAQNLTCCGWLSLIQMTTQIWRLVSTSRAETLEGACFASWKACYMWEVFRFWKHVARPMQIVASIWQEWHTWFGGCLVAKPTCLCMCLLIIGWRWEREATSQSHACCIWIRRLITVAKPKFPAAVLVKEMSGHATLGYFLLLPQVLGSGFF